MADGRKATVGGNEQVSGDFNHLAGVENPSLDRDEGALITNKGFKFEEEVAPQEDVRWKSSVKEEMKIRPVRRSEIEVIVSG